VDENELKYAAAEGTFAYHHAEEYMSLPLRDCSSKTIPGMSNGKVFLCTSTTWSYCNERSLASCNWRIYYGLVWNHLLKTQTHLTKNIKTNTSFDPISSSHEIWKIKYYTHTKARMKHTKSLLMQFKFHFINTVVWLELMWLSFTVLLDFTNPSWLLDYSRWRPGTAENLQGISRMNSLV
jgi:hypothetical protein